MLKIFRKKLAIKTSLLLSLVAVPIMAAGIALVVVNEHASVKELVLQKGRMAALVGAQTIGLALERGVAAGAFKMEDLFDTKYIPVEFPFTVDNPPGTIRGRFHTNYDTWAEKDGWQAFEDSFLRDPDFIYSTAIDQDGYVPVPNAFQGEKPNGDKKHDEKHRWKMRYNSTLHLTAARYEDKEPTVVQDYARKADQQVWDVAAPVWVYGKHWGAFRVGVLQEQISARGQDLAKRLAWFLGIALATLIAIIFLLLQRSMRPLVDLTGVAFRLSMGETKNGGSSEDELRTKIRPTTDDEIGEMAKSLNRLRLSLASLMDRDAERHAAADAAKTPVHGSAIVGTRGGTIVG